MHRALAMTTKARSTNRYVSASAENAFPPNYEEFFEPRREGYAQLGLAALELVNDLRKQYGIATKTRSELGSEWDPKAHLHDMVDRFEKQRNRDRRHSNDLL